MADTRYTDRQFMEMAIEEAQKSKSLRQYDPRVGAVVARGDQLIESAFRGEGGAGWLAPRKLSQFEVEFVA